MSSSLIDGARTWSMTRDAEGHRNYTIKFQAKTTSPLDGPAIVMQTPGLFYPGAVWSVDNDYDPWAWCRPDMQITPMVEDEPNLHWEIVQTFSTRFPDGIRFQRCNDFNIEDPLLEPQRVSGSFVKYSKEATHDRFGRAILTSSLEQVRGQQVEFDENSRTVSIEQNVPLLQMNIFDPMVDTLNHYPLWGMPPRTIKLSNVSWDVKYYGVCYKYYTRKFEFEVNSNGFDRLINDEGNKVLNGHWNSAIPNVPRAWVLDNINGAAPNRFNPTHFIRAHDPGHNLISIMLDGEGKPYTPDAVPATEFIDTGWNTPRNIQPPTTNTAGLPVPSGVTAVASDGGSMDAGNYTYAVTAKSTTGETTKTTASILIVGDGDLVTISWSAIVGAISYRIYRLDTGIYKLVGEVKAPTNGPGKIYVQKYDESDFLLLGIPTSF